MNGDTVVLKLDKAYTGKAVEETFSKAALLPLAGPTFHSMDDVIGFTFESEGDGWIHGLVGVGSGNERFLMKTADFSAALGD